MEEIRLTEEDMVAYTYCVVWKKYNKQYYGIRYKRGCKSSDMWTKYFTSSKVVKRFREEFGEPDLIIIDQFFTDIEEARDYEEFILQDNNVRNNDDWLNLTDRKGPIAPCGDDNPMKKPEIVAKMLSNRGTFTRPDIAGDKHHMKRPEIADKIRQAALGRPRPDMTGENSHMKRPEIARKVALALSGDKNYNYDNTLRVFFHHDHGRITCTKHHLRTTYGLNQGCLHRVILGEQNTVKGWRYIGLAEDQPENES